MKQLMFLISGSFFLISCTQKNIPDVSSIEIKLETKRFEQDFFSMDTSNLTESMGSLFKKYPHFTQDFIFNILGLDPDSLLIPDNDQQQAVRIFIHDYKPIKDSAYVIFKNFSKETAEIKRAFQFVKYYFPKYKLPTSIITFIGPLNANFQTSFGTQSDILTPVALGIGLQLHLGNEFSFYQSPAGQALYPDYISNNFDAAHIPVNSMRIIIDDMYPDKSTGRPLLDQIVERGRKMYLLSQFLPGTPDYINMGYTETQMKAAYENEAVIWNFFLSNDLLNNSEQDMIKNYIGESPKTREFGDNSPGNLGTFSGLQIVRKYVSKFPGTTLDSLMKMAPAEVYSLSKYKPKN